MLLMVNGIDYFQSCLYAAADCSANFQADVAIPTDVCLPATLSLLGTNSSLYQCMGNTVQITAYSDDKCTIKEESVSLPLQCLPIEQTTSMKFSCGGLSASGIGVTLYTDSKCTQQATNLVVMASGVCSAAIVNVSAVFSVSCNSKGVTLTNYSMFDSSCSKPLNQITYPLMQCVQMGEGEYAIFNFCGHSLDLITTWWFWLAIGGGSVGVLLILIIAIVLFTRANRGYTQIN